MSPGRKLLAWSLVAAFVACGEGGLEPVVDTFPAGAFEVTILETEIPARGDLRALPGRWRIVLLDDGAFLAFRDDALLVSGSFTATLDTFTVTENTDVFACSETTGSYLWSFDGTDLTLEAMSDGCGARRILLTLKPLRKTASG